MTARHRHYHLAAIAIVGMTAPAIWVCLLRHSLPYRSLGTSLLFAHVSAVRTLTPSLDKIAITD